MEFSISNVPVGHLRRLTDGQGLIHAARGDCPDRFNGYDLIDNADALRWCASSWDMVERSEIQELARICFGFLRKGRDGDGRMRHHRDAIGRWTRRSDDAVVQSRAARALAGVIASELPVDLRLASSEWWNALSPASRGVRSARAAGNWLMAMCTLPGAHPGRNPERIDALARWLVEDCYYPMRSNDWEWFEQEWQPTGACIPSGLWMAAKVLDEPRYRVVAEASTQFLIEQMFEEGLFVPVGSRGGWSRHADKAVFDQLPAEACSFVELLCIAEQCSGSSWYGQYAQFAGAWFTGNNVRGTDLTDPSTGACHDAITVHGIDENQGASATVACLLTHAALAHRPALVVEETTVYALGAGG